MNKIEVTNFEAELLRIALYELMHQHPLPEHTSEYMGAHYELHAMMIDVATELSQRIEQMLNPESAASTDGLEIESVKQLVKYPVQVNL